MFYSGGKNFSPGLKPVTVQRGQGFLPESWSVRGLGRASLMSPCVLGLKTATRIFKFISWGQALTLFFIFVTFFSVSFALYSCVPQLFFSGCQVPVLQL